MTSEGRPTDQPPTPVSTPVPPPSKVDSAIALIEEWLNDESGYDEETWPKLEKTLEENRLSTRRRFND
jgi:hypothetical protein